VAGIFDRPPQQSGARLVRQVVAGPTGWTARTRSGDLVSSLETCAATHDVSGGVEAKVTEAVRCLAGCGTAAIVEAGTPAAVAACRAEDLPDGWIGTEIVRAAEGDGL